MCRDTREGQVRWKEVNYSGFVKLVGKRVESFRMKAYMTIATEWEISGTALELLKKKGIVELFNSNSATTEQVSAHCASVCPW